MDDAVLPSVRVFDEVGQWLSMNVMPITTGYFISFLSERSSTTEVKIISNFIGLLLLILIESEARGVHSLARGLCPYGALMHVNL